MGGMDNGVFYADSYSYKISMPLKWRLEEGKYEFCGDERAEEEEVGAQPYCIRIAPEVYPDNLTDDDDDVPIVGNALFCGKITGVRLITSGYVKRSSVIVKKKSDVMPRGRDRNVGETDMDISDNEEEGRSPVGMVEEHRTKHKVRRIGRSILCAKCGVQFRTEGPTEENYAACSSVSQSLQFVDRAARQLKTVLRQYL